MVIQRIQSVYLLLAALLLGAVCFFVPVGVVQDMTADATQLVYLKDCLSVFPLTIVTVVLILIDIFLFKNLRLQIRVAGVCIAMVMAVACVCALLLGWRMPENVSVTWIGPALVLAAALIMMIFARRSMKGDMRLLKSYDRIR